MAVFSFENIKVFRHDELLRQSVTQIIVIINKQNFLQLRHHGLRELLIYKWAQTQN